MHPPANLFLIKKGVLPIGRNVKLNTSFTRRVDYVGKKNRTARVVGKGGAKK